MPWRQVVDANWRIPYVGGWCEGYVAGAWGQATLPTPENQVTYAIGAGGYGSAIEKWNANVGGGNHSGELPPVGKTVPVYFSLGNVWQGHTAISLDDGYIASSSQGGYHTQGYIHQNLDNIIWAYGQYNGGCTYLGWSEFVGNIRVIEWYDLPRPPIEPPVVIPPIVPPVIPPIVIPPVIEPPVVVPEPIPEPEPPIIIEEPTEPPVQPGAKRLPFPLNFLIWLFNLIAKLLKGVK